MNGLDCGKLCALLSRLFAEYHDSFDPGCVSPRLVKKWMRNVCIEICMDIVVSEVRIPEWFFETNVIDSIEHRGGAHVD